MKGLGQQLKIGDVVIENLTSFTPPQGSRGEISTNTLTSGSATSVSGRKDWGTCEGTGRYKIGAAGQVALAALYDSGAVAEFHEVYTDDDGTTTETSTFNAWCQNFALDQVQDTDTVMYKFTLRVTGDRTVA